MSQDPFSKDTSTKPKATILIVEDEEDLRKLLRLTLERRGYTIHEAKNGQEGVEMFNQLKDTLGLIVSDVRMPVMDGIKFLEHVRSVSKVPFIFMTGFAESLDARKAADLGANDFISKPFRASNLTDIVARLT